ncbi:MAG: ABC transporter ATP-binding protein [Chloroflexota bacterium]|nr:ABC transporter ATP-binding protein [Chloroflexota bacterium]
MAVAKPADRTPRRRAAGRRADVSAEADVAIRTHRLTKRYGDFTAVDGLDLTVYQGEVFGLLGPNGAGKTTTILMLLGLSEPSAGSARVLGLDPARNPLEIKRRVGYLPDAVGFYSGLTGRQNLRYTARLNGLSDDVAEERISVLLERVGLADAADQPVETYSRGMKQRLGLADTLVKDPLIVVLDEPTTAIDPTGVVEVLGLVRELAASGVAVLLSSHLLHQLQQVCDRVGIFVAGRLVAVGPMGELAEQLGSGPLVIEVMPAGSAPEAAGVLRQVPGVIAVETDPRDPRLLLVTVERDVRAEVATALSAAGQPPLHLRRRGDELDEIYRRYFTAGEARA